MDRVGVGAGGGGCYMHVAVIRVTFIVIAILHSFIIDIGTISHYAILIVTFIMILIFTDVFI